MPRLLPLLLLLLVTSVAGCKDEADEARLDLLVERTSWDSVRVSARPVRTWFGIERPADPDSTWLVLLDADYDTLTVGAPGWLRVPDAALGDEERLLVEACGLFGERSVCTQESMRASPKRLDASPDLTYPLEGDIKRGRLRLDLEAYRQVWGDSTSWEPIDLPKDAGILLRADATAGTADEERVVQLALDGRGGTFDLSRAENYQRFAYDVNASLFEGDSAEVTFHLLVGLDAAEREPLAELRRVVSPVPERTSTYDVWQIVRTGTRRLLDELGAHDARQASATVSDWRVERIGRRYVVDVEVEWTGRRTFWERTRYRVEGRFRVPIDGSEASFTFEDGNRYGREFWRERVRGNRLALGSIDLPEENPEPEDRSYRLRG